MKKRKKELKQESNVPLLETINLEEIRRMRSLGSDFGRVGYDPFTVKLSKISSSKHFFEPYYSSEDGIPFEKAN